MFEILPSGPVGESALGLDFSHTGGDAVLARRANEMVSQLSMTYDFIKKNDPEAPVSFDKALAECVFTETNLRQFVRAYFHHLHWYNPIIHRPTFHIETAHLPLLLAVFLFGSLCCTPQDAALSAREFFDLAEEYVFSHPTLKRPVEDRGSGGGSSEEIEILQAALTIEIVQNPQQQCPYTKAPSPGKASLLGRRHADFNLDRSETSVSTARASRR